MGKDGTVYPVTSKSVHQYAKDIFSPIINGECVTTIWVPMAGRRMWNKFIINNISLFKDELPGYEKYILVYIEPLDLTEESLSGYMRLMGKSFIESCKSKKGLNTNKYIFDQEVVFDDEGASYTRLYDTFRRIVSDVTSSGYKIAFFLGEFDELQFTTSIFYNNLKSLWSRFYPYLYYVFLSVDDLSRPEMPDKYKELNAAILQNVIYIPLRKGEDVDYVIDYFEEKSKITLTSEHKSLIKRLCGGHPFLIRVAIKIISSDEKLSIDNIEKLIKKNYEILSIVRRIYSLRSTEEKEIIDSIINNQNVGDSDELDRLIALGLIQRTKEGKLILFGELLSLSLERTQKSQQNEGFIENRLYLDEKEGSILYMGKSIEEDFSNQEYRVIRYLLNEPGRLRTREQIGEIIWGEESYEKYSDWAIDQLMSKLRKKLKNMGVKTSVVTVRGRGYKLINE